MTGTVAGAPSAGEDMEDETTLDAAPEELVDEDTDTLGASRPRGAGTITDGTSNT